MCKTQPEPGSHLDPRCAALARLIGCPQVLEHQACREEGQGMHQGIPQSEERQRRGRNKSSWWVPALHRSAGCTQMQQIKVESTAHPLRRH